MRFKDVPVGDRCRTWDGAVTVIAKVPRGETAEISGRRFDGPTCVVEYEDGQVTARSASRLQNYEDWKRGEQVLDATSAMHDRIAAQLREQFRDPVTDVKGNRTTWEDGAITLMLGMQDAGRLLALMGKRKLTADDLPVEGESEDEWCKRTRRIGLRLARQQKGVSGVSFSMHKAKHPDAVACISMSADAAQRWLALLDGRGERTSALEVLLG